MKSQVEIWAQSEGGAWLDRNRAKFPIEHDPVLEIIDANKLNPQSVLEIGCGNGWRLDAIRERQGGSLVQFQGVDPSSAALQEARRLYPYCQFWYGSAGTFLASDKFDLVVFGFCLYQLDRSELFYAVANADKALKDGGHLIIYDFWAEHPHMRPYHHNRELWTYKMDYSKLFLANPAYKEVDRTGDEEHHVVLLKKDVINGWPYP